MPPSGARWGLLPKLELPRDTGAADKAHGRVI